MRGQSPTSLISHDTDKAVLDHKEAKLDAELKKFLEPRHGEQRSDGQTPLFLGHEKDREVRRAR
jgi:hypothetical protein